MWASQIVKEGTREWVWKRCVERSHNTFATFIEKVSLLRSCCWRRRCAWRPAWATRRRWTARWTPWIAYEASRQRPALRPTHRRRLGHPATRLAAAHGRRRRRAQHRTSGSPAAAGLTGHTAAPPALQGPAAGTLRHRQQGPRPAVIQMVVSQQVCRILLPRLATGTATT